MRRLSKRWEPLKTVYVGGALYRTLLAEVNPNDPGYCWACIECPDIKGPFRLEIWNMQDGEWEHMQIFHTLKQAKEVGRLLAGIALNKNI